MRLLLDTQIFIWASAEPARLSNAASAAIVADGNSVFVSAATAWEIAIKVSLGRLAFCSTVSMRCSWHWTLSRCR